jgi:hypothetical protein
MMTDRIIPTDNTTATGPGSDEVIAGVSRLRPLPFHNGRHSKTRPPSQSFCAGISSHQGTVPRWWCPDVAIHIQKAGARRIPVIPMSG